MTIIVGIGSDKGEGVVGEMMRVEEVELGHIGEMVTDPARLDTYIPGMSAKASAIAEANGDDKPEFPVVRVEEGWSRSNRLWDAPMLDTIAEQCSRLQPVAHLGHIDDDKIATAFPDPQTTWLGAITKDEPSQMKDRLGKIVKTIYFAGYNHPGAKVRQHIKCKAVNGVSWWGTGRQVPVPGRGVHMQTFNLKAVDWARKLAEGMPSASIVAIASEMEGGNMDKPLSAVTPEEFKQENPNGYKLIVDGAVAEQATVIGEMEDAVKAAKAEQTLLAKIREFLKLEPDADPYDTIVKMASRLGAEAKALVDKHLDKVLAAKVPDEKDRALVRRLLPVGEMVSKSSDAKDDEAVEKIVGEMTTAAFDTDDTIKTFIGEQAPPNMRRREELRGGGGSADGALKEYGMTRERVKMGG